MPTTDSTPSSSTQRIPVALGDRGYQIVVSTDTVASFATEIIQAVGDLSHALILADAAVASSIAAPLATSLSNRDIRVSTTEIPSGETSKSIAELARIWDWMLDQSTDRRSVVIAVGGGVTGDLAGFAAASYARGLRVVQIPTTLLSMVDSSVGGKTGINLAGAKNMVGAFWQPSLVLADTQTLTTLGQREYASGLAEVIKYGVIEDVKFFHWLEDNIPALVQRDPPAMREAIARSCLSKARVVGEDERETSGRRAILNYGHTFAHAIEATAGYGTWLHGEAVAIGMQMAAKLAFALGRVTDDLLARQTSLLSAAGLPISYDDADIPSMIDVMRRDKKVEHGKLRFVLPTKIGHVELVSDVDETLVAQVIADGAS